MLVGALIIIYKVKRLQFYQKTFNSHIDMCNR